MTIKQFKYFLIAALIVSGLIFISFSCSVEKKITKECDFNFHLVDTLHGKVIACIYCDSIKPSLINRINKKIEKKHE